MATAQIGDKIKIYYMKDEPDYTFREGIVRHIDDIGQLHGTWGGLAIIPEFDNYEIIKRRSTKLWQCTKALTRQKHTSIHWEVE